MGRIINLQVPTDEHGTMSISMKECEHIMEAFKQLFPNDEIILSPMRLVPTDEQYNIELTEKLLAHTSEIYRQSVLMDFCEGNGVDNWDPGYSISRSQCDYYFEHGTLDGWEDKY